MAGSKFCHARVCAFGIGNKPKFNRGFNALTSRPTRGLHKGQCARPCLLSASTAILLTLGSQAHDCDSDSVPAVQKAQAPQHYFSTSAGPLAPAVEQWCRNG